MIEVDKEYISKAINDLFRLLGVKQNIPYNSAHWPFEQGKIEECIKVVADYLGLPIKVNLAYVPSQYSPTYRESERFVSEALTKTDGKRRGVAGITAQVCIPSYLPLYGTNGLINFPIDIKVSENVKEYPDAFIAVMAHELSHIVLCSLQYSEKDNEIYADVAAMLLGFNEVMEKGRKTMKEYEENTLFSNTTITETVTYGYLTDENFRFVHNRIAKILKQNEETKKRFIKKYKSLQKRVKSLKYNILKFENYMAYLDKKCKTNIKLKDAQKIVSFHKWGYNEEIKTFTGFIEQELAEKQKYQSMNHFPCGLFDNLNKDLETLGSDIREKEKLLHEDLIVLKRNVNFLTRLR